MGLRFFILFLVGCTVSFGQQEDSFVVVEGIGKLSNGAPSPQKKLMAKRAAKIVALNQLKETLIKLSGTSDFLWGSSLMTLYQEKVLPAKNPREFHVQLSLSKQQILKHYIQLWQNLATVERQMKTQEKELQERIKIKNLQMEKMQQEQKKLANTVFEFEEKQKLLKKEQLNRVGELTRLNKALELEIEEQKNEILRLKEAFISSQEESEKLNQLRKIAYQEQLNQFTQKYEEKIEILLKKKAKALTTNMQRFNYWCNKFEEGVCEEEFYEDAVFEIARMQGRQILARLLEFLKEGTNYLIHNKDIKKEKEKFYFMIVKALGRSGNPKVGESLLTCLSLLAEDVSVQPIQERPLVKVFFMVELARALKNAHVTQASQTLGKIRLQMGHGLFREQTKTIYSILSKLDGFGK